MYVSHAIAPTGTALGRRLAGVAAIELLYAAMYGLNYWLPLQSTNYTTPIWDWSQAALSVAAVWRCCVTSAYLRHKQH
ncbi:MAG: hypothetical protein U0Z44_06050 [Kouleothrix sp.]